MPANRFDNLAIALAQFLIKHPLWVIFASILITSAVTIGASKLSFSNSYRIFFSDENPELKAFDDFLDVYSKNDLALLVIQSPSGSVLEQDYAATLEWATDQAWQIPFATRVDSITNFQYSFSEDDDLIVENLVEFAEQLSAEELEQKLDIALAEDTLRGNLISTNGSTTAIAVTVNLPELSLDENPQVANAMRELADQIQQRHPELKLALSGVIMLNNAFSEASINDLKSLVPAMYAVLIIMSIIVLRSFWSTVSVLLVILFSCLSAMGLAGSLGIPLSPVAVSAPTIIMTLAIADSIHIIVSMLASYAKNGDKHQAIIESLRVNLVPVTLTSVTTIIGFLTLNFSDAPPYWHLGNITAIGIIFAWLLSLSFLPAILSILPIKQPKPKAENRSYLVALADWIGRKHQSILIIGGLLSASLIYSSTHIELNDEFIKYFSPDIEFRRDADFTTENLSGLYTIEYSFSSGEADGINQPLYLENIERFANWLREQDEVKHVYSHSDIIKRLNRNMHNEDVSFFKVPDTVEAAAQFLLLYELSLPRGLDLQNRISIDKSETRMTAILKSISSVELQNLNDRAHQWQKQHWQSAEPSRATGTAVMFSYISKRNVESMMVGNVIAVLSIGLIMLLLLRSLPLALISILANGLPVILMFGIWALIVGKVGMVASAIAASTLGIVVDDTVHFLSKYLRARREKSATRFEAIEETLSTVGVAIISTTIILVSGFFILAFSDFQLNQQTGLLSSITIAIALFFDLFMLPAILLIGAKSKHRNGKN